MPKWVEWLVNAGHPRSKGHKELLEDQVADSFVRQRKVRVVPGPKEPAARSSGSSEAGGTKSSAEPTPSEKGSKGPPKDKKFRASNARTK